MNRPANKNNFISFINHVLTGFLHSHHIPQTVAVLHWFGVMTSDLSQNGSEGKYCHEDE